MTVKRESLDPIRQKSIILVQSFRVFSLAYMCMCIPTRENKGIMSIGHGDVKYGTTLVCRTTSNEEIVGKDELMLYSKHTCFSLIFAKIMLVENLRHHSSVTRASIAFGLKFQGFFSGLYVRAKRRGLK